MAITCVMGEQITEMKRGYECCVIKRLTTTVEADRGLEGNAFLGGGGLDIIRLSGIESSHVCLVVLGVVERHDLLRDVGLERIVGIREGGKTVSHGDRKRKRDAMCADDISRSKY